MKSLPLLALILVLTVLPGCGRPDAQWDKVITNCGPGLQCPIYIKGNNWYYQDTDGGFKPLPH